MPWCQACELPEIEQTQETEPLMVTKGLEPVPDASNPWFVEKGTLITLIKPWCGILECLRNDTFSALHSTRAGCPLDTLKIYWNDPKESSWTCLTANTLETDLLWTYLIINLIYIFHLILYKNLLFSAMYSRLEQAPPRSNPLSLSQWLLSVIRFSKSHPKGVSVNPEETWFLNIILLNPPLELWRVWPRIDSLLKDIRDRSTTN